MKELLGGVSANGCVYDVNRKKLSVSGWFYPIKEYNTIEVYYNNSFLGVTKCGLERQDVYANLKKQDALNTGFSGEFSLDGIKANDKTILMIIKKNNEIVSYRVCEVKILSYKEKIENHAKYYGISCILPIESREREIKWIESVEDINELDKSAYYIICTENWEVLIDNLENIGLKCFQDFVPMWYCYFLQNGMFRLDLVVQIGLGEKPIKYLEFLKLINKLCFLYGNCQIYKIGEILSKEKNFMMNYIVVRTPTVMRLGEFWRRDIREIFSMADLFIYQNISVTNKWGVYYSTEYILTALSESAKRICIPNMYFTGYWPQYEKNMKDYLLKGCEIMPYGDKNIRKIFEKTGSCNVEELLKDDFYSYEEFIQNIDDTIKKLRVKEELCDIIISDYIEENYQLCQLFYTVNHPTLCLYYEFVKRLLRALGIENAIFNGEVLKQNGSEIPIYPSIERYMAFKQARVNFNVLMDNELSQLTKKEWMKRYICFFYE